MPKERITFSKAEKVHIGCDDKSCKRIEDPGNSHPPVCSCPPVVYTYPALFVRWANDGHDRTGNVQISLLKYQQPAWDEWIATDPYDQTDTVYPTPPIADEFFSQVLSRSEINELIKALRRAREQAYGKDE